MSILNNSLLLGADAGAAGYQISRSLRFNSSDSAFCSRTFSSAGNRRTWTWAGWVKRSELGDVRYIFSAPDSSGDAIRFGSSSDNKLFVGFFAPATSAYTSISTAAEYRDPSAWLHIVVATDTTQATASDRVKLYVNGVQVTAFSSATYPAQNAEGRINTADLHRLGRPGTDTVAGYLADVFFIDGQALTPSSFTEVSATTGQLIPKAYTGSFGTNGFWLKFSDNSAATATTLGKDYSPNGNNWTPNNLSVTAGAGNDSLVDTPTSAGTDTGAGGQVTGNYATWNPLDTLAAAAASYTNGNLNTSYTTANYTGRATIGVTSGKWYWEILVTTSGNPIGLATAAASTSNYPGQNSSSWGYYGDNGNKYNNGSATSYGASFTTNDVVGVAFDADNGTLTFYKNGTSQGTAFTGLTSGPYFPAIGNGVYAVNFGQRQWAYAAPAGFKALCDTNLPAPTIAKPNTVMGIATYSGNNGSNTLTTGVDAGTYGGLLWIKNRSTTAVHNVLDNLRGYTNPLELPSTAAEYSFNPGITPTSTGYTLNTGSGQYNASGSTYVAWHWAGGTTTATNTQGSITSQVRANASAGFSIVTYTGNNTAGATIGHGLGVAPQMLIIKRRDATGTWRVGHSSLPSWAYRLNLDETDLTQINTGAFNSTAPTSTVFTVGSGDTSTNASGGTYVAYCFAPVAGYSSFGSYTGNGSTDGPFVYTGFRPRWVLIRSIAGPRDWLLYDTARGLYNPQAEGALQPNTSGTAYSSGSVGSPYENFDILSNGFKLRNSINNLNTNAEVHIYAAFAENPFQYARAR